MPPCGFVGKLLQNVNGKTIMFEGGNGNDYNDSHSINLSSLIYTCYRSHLITHLASVDLPLLIGQRRPFSFRDLTSHSEVLVETPMVEKLD